MSAVICADTKQTLDNVAYEQHAERKTATTILLDHELDNVYYLCFLSSHTYSSLPSPPPALLSTHLLHLLYFSALSSSYQELLHLHAWETCRRRCRRDRTKGFLLFLARELCQTVHPSRARATSNQQPVTSNQQPATSYQSPVSGKRNGGNHIAKHHDTSNSKAICVKIVFKWFSLHSSRSYAFLHFPSRCFNHLIKLFLPLVMPDTKQTDRQTNGHSYNIFSTTIWLSDYVLNLSFDAHHHSLWLCFILHQLFHFHFPFSHLRVRCSSVFISFFSHFSRLSVFPNNCQLAISTATILRLAFPPLFTLRQTKKSTYHPHSSIQFRINIVMSSYKVKVLTNLI